MGLPEEFRGSGLGLLRSAYFLISAAGPWSIGLMADRGLFDEAFLCLALLLFVGIIISAFLE
jgi:hypothetical protein